ncbi:MAG: hypothetical protein Q9207_008274, partial [Kuettlingeria erythrocarpa]
MGPPPATFSSLAQTAPIIAPSPLTAPQASTVLAPPLDFAQTRPPFPFAPPPGPTPRVSFQRLHPPPPPDFAQTAPVFPPPASPVVIAFTAVAQVDPVVSPSASPVLAAIIPHPSPDSPDSDIPPLSLPPPPSPSSDILRPNSNDAFITSLSIPGLFLPSPNFRFYERRRWSSAPPTTTDIATGVDLTTVNQATGSESTGAEPKPTDTQPTPEPKTPETEEQTSLRLARANQRVEGWLYQLPPG